MTSGSPSRILIYGWGKTGTTALYYKILGALEGESVLGMFEPKGPYQSEWEQERPMWVLVKALWHGVTLEEYPSYKFFDKRIWTIRDPRDFMISLYLYHWNSQKKDKERIARVLELLRAKEQDPDSVSFRELAEHEYVGVESLRVPNLNRRMRRTSKLLERVDPSIVTFKYEDMIDGDFRVLENYLGFPVSVVTEVPDHKIRVLRSRSYGNWRNWFTPSDVEYYRPVFEDYLRSNEYGGDWQLSEARIIDRETSSEYVRRLVESDLPPQT